MPFSRQFQFQVESFSILAMVPGCSKSIFVCSVCELETEAVVLLILEHKGCSKGSTPHLCRVRCHQGHAVFRGECVDQELNKDLMTGGRRLIRSRNNRALQSKVIWLGKQILWSRLSVRLNRRAVFYHHWRPHTYLTTMCVEIPVHCERGRLPTEGSMYVQ